MSRLRHPIQHVGREVGEVVGYEMDTVVGNSCGLVPEKEKKRYLRVMILWSS